MLSEYSSVNSNTFEGNVSFWRFHGKANNGRFYMKYSTVFSPVNTIIQTRIVLRVLLPDNQKNFTQSRSRENFNPLFPTLKNWICDSFADAHESCSYLQQ